MDAKVTWDGDLRFTGVAESGYAVKMDSQSGPESGVGPVEMTVLALGGCTAMDVISILAKKRQQVSEFHVAVHAERATDYPKVITSAELEYVVAGQGIEEASLLRAIELSAKQYCPVYAMLRRAFPIVLKYSILETSGTGGKRLVKAAEFPQSLLD